MSIVFIRHAHTEWNGPPKRYQGREDISLSQKGILACKALSKHISQPAHIISSPALRCKQTVHYLLQNASKSIRLDERLWEIDNGYFSGLYESEAAKRYSQMYNQWHASPTSVRLGGGETLQEMRNRVISATKEIINLYKGDETLIVTHGGPIKTILLTLNSCSLDNFHSISVNNLQHFALDEKEILFLKEYKL